MTPSTTTTLVVIDRPGGGASLRLELIEGKTRPLVEISLWSTRTDGSAYPLPGRVVGIRGEELLAVIEALRSAWAALGYTT